jgi:hypothetical protein
VAIGLGLITAVAASYWQTRLDSYWQRTLHNGKELVSGQTAHVRHGSRSTHTFAVHRVHSGGPLTCGVSA